MNSIFATLVLASTATGCELLLPADRSKLEGTGRAGGSGSMCVSANCPDTTGDCKAPTCTNNACDMKDEALGTVCTVGGAVCDAAGNCIECNADADCTADPVKPHCDVATHTCAAALCMNGMLDEIETDIDCGGPNCAKCGATKTCAAAGDCVSDSCTTTKCDQSVTGGYCGGDGDCTSQSCVGFLCRAVGFGLPCTSTSDCLSNICTGMMCDPGAVGKPCNAGSDCTSANCTADLCTTNGAGGTCAGPGDCLSGSCTANSCAKGASGTTCVVNGDCETNVCQANKTCT